VQSWHSAQAIGASGRSVKLLILIPLLLLLAGWAQACPFCNPSSQDMYTITSNSRVVARVERVGGGKFKILELLKGEAKIGRIVLAGESRQPSKQKADILVVSTVSNPNQPYWSDPARPLSTSEFEFLKTSLSAGSEQKLYDIAARHLGNESDLITESAYNILAVAPLQAVQKRASLIGQKQLVQWLQNPATPSARKSLYLLMALPGLNAQDQGWIQKQMFDDKLSPYADHLPPLMAAYAEVSGAKGVEQMRRRWLAPTTSTSASFGATSGFVFIGNNSRNPETREAARQVFRAELKHPERGVFAISTLGEWRDFEVADSVEELAYQNAETPWVVTSATRYFRSFDNDRARAALKRLQARFPKIVDSAGKPYQKM
jgi:hypothetical protein